MPQHSAANLATLLSSATIDDHEELLKAADAILRVDPFDELAQRTRIVALLNLDRFEDVSQTISEGTVKLQAACALEKAYALYKMGNLEEATVFLSSTGITKRSMSHVAAQVAYRAENFDEVLSIYNQLLAADSEEEADDLDINMKAAQAQMYWSGIAMSHNAGLEKPSDTFEPCYNAACACVAQGMLDQASKLLHRALALCDASDELTDQDREEERKPILVQQALVLVGLGQSVRAREVLELLNNEPDNKLELDLGVTIQNNLRALEQTPQNPFVLEAEAVAWKSSLPKAKLFSFQARVLRRNIPLIDFHACKTAGIKSRQRRALQSAAWPSCDPYVIASSILGAMAVTRHALGTSLLGPLLALLQKQSNDTGLVLAIMHLHLRRKDLYAALRVLESFFSRLDGLGTEQSLRVRFSPGLVALAVSLRKCLKRPSAAKRELVQAARFWYGRPGGIATSLLTEAGVELVSSPSKNDLDLAAATFTRLHQETQTSPMTRAGVVAATAVHNLPASKEYAADMPSVESLIKSVDVDGLIQLGVSFPAASSVHNKRPFDDDSAGERTLKKRSRRRLPKNVINGQEPDPERWLPLRDRSYYRPKGKKGRKKFTDATQGGSSRQVETLGLVGGGGVKVEKSSIGPSQKKKKKGKK